MADEDIDLGIVNIGSTDKFQFTIKKGGVIWDLSNGTVTVTFEKPDRTTQFTRAMSSLDATTGVFSYTTTTSEIDEVGWWTLQVRVIDGAITKRYPGEISFYVRDLP